MTDNLGSIVVHQWDCQLPFPTVFRQWSCHPILLAEGQWKYVWWQRDISSHTMVFIKVSYLDDLVSPFPGCGSVTKWNDEHTVIHLVSYFVEQPMNIEQELCRFDVLVRTMGDRLARPPVSCLAIWSSTVNIEAISRTQIQTMCICTEYRLGRR